MQQSYYTGHDIDSSNEHRMESVELRVSIRNNLQIYGELHTQLPLH